MAKKGRTMRPEWAAAAHRPENAVNGHMSLEDCRTRLQSVEVLLDSAPRDALVLARALLHDAVVLLATLHLPADARAEANPDAVMRVLPGTDRGHLLAARRWLEDTDPTAVAATEGVVALRRVIADLARATDRTEVTGLAAFREAFRRATWLQAGIGAAVAVALLVAVLVISGAESRRAAEFNARFSEASARQAAGDHAGAVERFGKAIAAQPGKDRTASAWNDMGWSLEKLGRHEEAVEAYRKALVLRPAFPLARNNLESAQRQVDLTKSEKARAPAPAGK